LDSGSSNSITSASRDDGAADRHALALAARQVGRLALQQRPQLQHVGSARDAARDLRFRRAADAQAERHIRFHVHGRIQRIGLEHQRDAAVLGVGPGHVLAADFDLAALVSISPAMLCSSVDLPQPDGPSSTTNSLLSRRG
jgi:hypothetical protein